MCACTHFFLCVCVRWQLRHLFWFENHCNPMAICVYIMCVWHYICSAHIWAKKSICASFCAKQLKIMSSNLLFIIIVICRIYVYTLINMIMWTVSSQSPEYMPSFSLSIFLPLFLSLSQSQSYVNIYREECARARARHTMTAAYRFAQIEIFE